MGLTYFKRFRMEVDLDEDLFVPPPLPPGYSIVPWRESLLDAHAEVKYLSFCYELDVNIFPCLGDREGCHRLMRDISRRESFLPRATWLLQYTPPGREKVEYCGTVQGLSDSPTSGSIQNLGIVPEHRGLGLGTRLLHAALVGFRDSGLERGNLEVTAQNTGAVRLYRRLGFRTVRTVYKAAEVVFA